MSLADIIQQLEMCGFQCEAGPLTNNVAFLALKEKAREGGAMNGTGEPVFGGTAASGDHTGHYTQARGAILWDGDPLTEHTVEARLERAEQLLADIYGDILWGTEYFVPGPLRAKDRPKSEAGRQRMAQIEALLPSMKGE